MKTLLAISFAALVMLIGCESTYPIEQKIAGVFSIDNQPAPGILVRVVRRSGSRSNLACETPNPIAITDRAGRFMQIGNAYRGRYAVIVQEDTLCVDDNVVGTARIVRSIRLPCAAHLSVRNRPKADVPRYPSITYENIS